MQSNINDEILLLKNKIDEKISEFNIEQIAVCDIF